MMEKKIKNMIKKTKKILSISFIVSMLILLSSCDSKIRRININGTYIGNSPMGYEAVVEAGTITIYSTSFFEKNIYWYGTCHANELDENYKLVSKRLETNERRSIFDFGSSLNRSMVSEREILFTEDSLTFVYDFSGMAVERVTLYKQNTGKRKSEYDSNADKLDPNYVDPTLPTPGPPGQTTEKPTEKPKEESKDIVPSEDLFSL